MIESLNLLLPCATKRDLRLIEILRLPPHNWIEGNQDLVSHLLVSCYHLLYCSCKDYNSCWMDIGVFVTAAVVKRASFVQIFPFFFISTLAKKRVLFLQAYKREVIVKCNNTFPKLICSLAPVHYPKIHFSWKKVWCVSSSWPDYCEPFQFCSVGFFNFFFKVTVHKSNLLSNLSSLVCFWYSIFVPHLTNLLHLCGSQQVYDSRNAFMSISWND